MKPRVSDIVAIMEGLAPPGLAEPWDRIGLQVGSLESPVEDILVTLDVEEEMAAPGRLVVCHHPLFLKPPVDLRLDRPLGRLLGEMVRAGTSVLVAHTNLDAARQGTADALYLVLKEPLGLQDAVPFAGSREYWKIVVFVPAGHEDEVREALASAGAGHIGRYSHCSFQARGTGTFKPSEGATPYTGRAGQLERVEEFRLETVVESALAPGVVRSMLDAHPYEEVAYDLYPVAQKGPGRFGRIADLDTPLSMEDLAIRVSAALSSPVRSVGSGEIPRLALVPGSGCEFLQEASSMGARCLITGDVRYHQAREALSMGFGLLDAGHFATEVPVVARLAGTLREGLSARNLAVPVNAWQSSDPFRYWGCS
ncbi:MAG: Nif3-like dinuclear metal center hexameric protein [Bacillota bacterium]